jgi:phosphatidylinositol-3-phosphatase
MRALVVRFLRRHRPLFIEGNMLKRLMLTTATTALLAGGAQAQRLGDIFVISMENHNFTQPASQTSPNQLFGNPAAPFQNSLITPGNPNAAQTSYASNYQNAGVGIHPSLPNYIWSEAGSNLGVTNDNPPFSPPGTGNNQNTTQHLSGLLQSQGTTWTSYQEDINLATNASNQLTNTVLSKNQWTVPLNPIAGTSPAYINPYNASNQFDYAPKHNPQVYFTDTNGGNNATPSNPLSQHYAPLQQLLTDLSNNTVSKYNWITPDQFNDSHSTLAGGFTYNGVHYTGDQASIAQGDHFLSIIVPQIEASQAYKNNGAIIIWWDETEGGDNAAHTLEEIVISPLAKGNAYTNNIFYTHSSDLLTMEELFGLGCIGGSCGANDLSDLFKPGAIPSAVPEPPTWAMVLLGFAGLGFAFRQSRRKVSFA